MRRLKRILLQYDMFCIILTRQIVLMWKLAGIELNFKAIEKEEGIEISSYNGWYRNNMGQWVLKNV